MVARNIRMQLNMNESRIELLQSKEESRIRTIQSVDASARNFFSKKTLGLVLGGLSLPIVIPFLQFGLVFKLWEEYAENVNKDHCSNSCWDTVFKGGYETGAGTYKHIYFNATLQSWLIWILTLGSVIALYESIKYLMNLANIKQLRYSMLLVFLSSIYPHYYGSWTFFNYLNDDFYEQFLHQLLFSITEIASTVMVLCLCDKGIQMTPRRLVFIITVATSHIFVSGWDQFVSNVLLREGFLHQVMRDVGFMIPDILHVAIPVRELQKIGKERRINPAYLIPNELAVSSLVYIFAFWLIVLML